MASNLNSEFNYRYQVIGSTPWEKIKTLQGFLVGRKRAAVLEECAELKYQAKLEELDHLRSIPAAKHLILNLRAEILELESHLDDQKHAFELNRKEIKILEKLMAELYMEVEPTRLKHEDGTPYTDDEMFEANANYEFTVTVGREIQAEIIANGRPSPAKLLNAMSNPQTLESLKLVGLVPNEATLLTKTDVVGLIGNSTAKLNTLKGISQ
jgi:maltooligosyltrehalose synthase